MSFTNKFEKIFKNLLPAPFTIAILLTFLTFFLALIITEPKNEVNHFIQILQFWDKGLWKKRLAWSYFTGVSQAVDKKASAPGVVKVYDR